MWELIRDGNSWCVSRTYWTRKAVMTPASCSALQKTPIHCKAGGYTGWQFNSHQLFHIKRISTNWTKLRKSWDWKTPAKYLNSDNYKDNVYYPPFSLLLISVLFKKKTVLRYYLKHWKMLPTPALSSVSLLCFDCSHFEHRGASNGWHNQHLYAHQVDLSHFLAYVVWFSSK